MAKQKRYYSVNTPGISGGPKYTSRHEALRFANKLLKDGYNIKISTWIELERTHGR